MTIRAKLIGAVNVPANTSLWAKLGSDPWVQVDIEAGLWFITADRGPRDLVLHVFDAIATETGDEVLDFTVLTTGLPGRLYVDNFGGEDIQLAYTDQIGSSTNNAEVIWDFFRWSTSSESFTITASGGAMLGSYAHQGGLYPDIYLMEDRKSSTPRAAQFVPDSGNVQTVTVGVAREKHSVSIRIDDAYPRDDSNSLNHYYALKYLWSECVQLGYPLRLYSDRDVNDAFEEGVEHRGFDTMTVLLESMDWDPTEAFGTWQAVWDMSFEGQKFTEPADWT